MGKCTVKQLLGVARSQIGYREGYNNANKFSRAMGSDHRPWCDDFVSWCFAELSATEIGGKFAYTPSHAAFFKAKDRWGHKPKVGALVFFNFPGDGVDRISHVGIVEAVRKDGSIVTIEGNTSSGVSGSQRDGGGVWRRVRGTAYVVGYGYPAYRKAAVKPRVYKRVKASGLNLRKGPAMKYRVIEVMKHGSKVEVLSKTKDGKWSKVKHGDDTGWCASRYLD